MRVTKEKAAENRERILTEAACLFRERGVSAVGMDALAEAAGMTHGSLYSQFDSKEHLAAEALGRAFDASAAKYGEIETLSAYVERYLSASEALLQRALSYSQEDTIEHRGYQPPRSA